MNRHRFVDQLVLGRMTNIFATFVLVLGRMANIFATTPTPRAVKISNIKRAAAIKD